MIVDFVVVAVVEDFQEVPPQLIGEHGKPEVIDEEHVDFGELTQETRAALQGVSASELFGQARQTEAAGGEVGAAGGVRERRGGRHRRAR